VLADELDENLFVAVSEAPDEPRVAGAWCCDACGGLDFEPRRIHGADAIALVERGLAMVFSRAGGRVRYAPVTNPATPDTERDGAVRSFCQHEQKAMTSDYLTCEELVLLVTDYFEGALSSVDRTRFDEHLMTCPPCQAHLEQIRRTIDVLGELPQDSLSPAAERDLLGAFREWKSD